MSQITVYIIAYNEEDKISAAVNSVLWADEIIVADSYSTDETAKIAESLGARVIQIPFTGFGDLRNQAISACRHDWIFSLDSDERCTPEARDEILAVVQSDTALDAYFMPRRNFFMGRWIRHSGFYPDYRQPQLFRKGALIYKTDPVHEGFVLQTPNRPGYLKNPIWQVPFKDLGEIQRKADRYSSLGAMRMATEGRKPGMARAFFHGLWAFIHHFFLKKGVLDGWAGFVIAFGNFEGTFYKYAKFYEKASKWTFPDSPPLRREE
jgi:glycosyltransferase involved in cell wall biosynthesis